ncbi:MAG TPA: aminoglycoside phosphotransferase family protein [Candidatus Limnocylindrales bacterium]
MRTEPDLDRRVLLDVLADRYLLDIERLEFVPYGIDSWSYAAVRSDGTRVFLKLVRPAFVAGATPRGAEFPLMAALADLGRVSVARPLPDRAGRLASAVDGFEISVLEYLEGRSLEDETIWPEALYARVAETVAAIHASTGAVRHLVPRAERFELPFLPPFTAALVALEAGELLVRGGPPSNELHDLVVPRAVALRAGIGRLEALRDLAHRRAADGHGAGEVLCHTDLWGSNLLLSADGTLHVLDWNGALLGPPEHDLFMFAGTGFFPADRLGWFLDRYEAAFQPVRLDADVFAFYLYRRSFEDLAAFVAELAGGSADAMDPSETLGIVAGILDDLPELQERVRGVRRVLAERIR